MNTRFACLMACTLAGTVASAADFSATRTGRLAVIDVVLVDNTSSGGTFSDVLSAGTFQFDYTDVDGARGTGQFAASGFSTFCAELQEVAGGSFDYDIINIENGPNPLEFNSEGPYDAADAVEVNALVAAAIRLGWINADLSSTGTTTNGLRAAIQIGIWRALLDNSTFSINNANVQNNLNILEAEAATNPTASVAGLRLMSSPDTQDMLFVLDDQPPVLVCDAVVTIEPIFSPCDWNMDGDVNSADVLAFLRDYDRKNADFNDDGRTDCRDLQAFIACYRDASCGWGKGGHGSDQSEITLVEVTYSAQDDGGEVVYDAYIETDCEQIPVMNGEIFELRASSNDCGSEIIDNRLVVTASEVRLVVIATDSAGNQVECGKVILEPKDDKDCDKGHGHGKDCGWGHGHGKDCGWGHGGHGKDCKDDKGGKGGHGKDCKDDKGGKGGHGKDDKNCKDDKGRGRGR